MSQVADLLESSSRPAIIAGRGAVLAARPQLEARGRPDRGALRHIDDGQGLPRVILSTSASPGFASRSLRASSRGRVTQEQRITCTQVDIVGGGPPGLVLSHPLHLQGIESVVLELRSRHVVETTVRACSSMGRWNCSGRQGVGERVDREGAVHNGVNLQFGGRRHRIDIPGTLRGRTTGIYGQQE